MSDDPVRTRVRSDEGWIDFQDWFVRPALRAGGARGGVRRRRGGARAAGGAGGTADPRPRAVVICPSNPFISIEPILAVPGMREAIAASRGAGDRRLAASSPGRR